MSGGPYTVRAPAYDPIENVIRVKIAGVENVITSKTEGTLKRVLSICWDDTTKELVYTIEE